MRRAQTSYTFLSMSKDGIEDTTSRKYAQIHASKVSDSSPTA